MTDGGGLPMTEQPTLAEVVRRLDGITAQLANIVTRLDSDRTAAAQTFVNRETYQADQRLVEALFKSVRADVTELEEARKTEDRWRRQSSFTLAVAVVNSLITIALAVITIVSR